ncbi:hypothetical protein Acsp03_03600 [Actinomadura sp. NBRC 104412]|uniref:hypothetical protein n=1 Tax=Actinomadura sp. NBRC 104412 TaxID=3032203 RepID=UPI0024A26F38|nr:hypothetical protein [Actinomadura sp. NBRC 104412]GLZ02893.1 hypothetical protein Acsp03_03600 [Actinomadura sp. NBRC 104412]
MTNLRTGCKYHSEPVERLQLYPGIGTRLVRLLSRSRDRFRAVHWPDSFEFRVPAKGDGYDFFVVVNFTWCVTGHAYGEKLISRASEHREILRDRAAARLRGVSRDFPPYEAGAAEKTFHGTLGELFAGTCLTYASGTVDDGAARPIEHYTLLRLDKPVRKAQREAWSSRQEAHNRHEEARMLAAQLGEQRLLWREFLSNGQADWLTPYAMALAENPEDAAKITEKMTGDRYDKARELATHIEKQVREYNARDAFDLMVQNDLVLRHLLRLIGVPGLPEAPSPFAER